MKQLNSARISLFFRRLVLFSILLSAISFAHAQCPFPYPGGDVDSTHRNVPVATVVTRNDVTAFGSGVALIPDTLYIFQQPSHGTVTVLNDSTIVYTPNSGFVGTDFYVYTVCNSCGNCAQASVSISVNYYCPAPAPVADYFTLYNNASTRLYVTSNDVNTAGGPLTVSLRRNGAHGNAVVSGAQIVYLGNGTYIGPDTLVYAVCDTCSGGSNCDTAFVYLNVIACQHVQAVNDIVALLQGGTTSVDVTLNDVNATGFGTATVTVISAPHFGSTVTLSGHTVTYHAGSGGFGKDSILYQICTDCGCDTAYAIFTVQQVPCSRPTAFVDNEYSGYSTLCSSTYNILGNDLIPVNSGTLTVTIVSGPAHGHASIVNNKLVYTCTDSAIGVTDQVTYSLCNACFCDTGTVAIHITGYPCNGVNPFINKDTAYVCNNYPVTINVTANDVDPEGGIVSIDTVVGAPQHGAVAKVDADHFKYTPVNGFHGHDFFVYQACDNGTPHLCNIATVDVFVLDCNTPPVILNSSNIPADTLHVTVYEDSFTNYCFHYAQQDTPYVFVSYISPSPDTVKPTAGSSVPGIAPCVSIVPPFQGRAEQTLEVVICNPYLLCDTVEMIIDIIPINHHPRAYPDALRAINDIATVCVNVLRNDQEDDVGDYMTITRFDSLSVHSGIVTKSSDSTLCYLTQGSYVGTDTFYYTICDTSHTCSTTYVVVTVPLVAAHLSDTIQQAGFVVFSSRFIGGTYLTLCSQPLHGTATVDSSNYITYTGNANYPVDPLNPDTTITYGLDSFCYTVCKVSGTDTVCANAEVVVYINARAKYYIPQGISPNGDGVNDFFVITSGDQFPKSQLLVYNRYGDEVWRNDTDGYKNDFDGTWKKNGQPLPDMSYWYIFKFNDNIHPDRMGYIVIER